MHSYQLSIYCSYYKDKQISMTTELVTKCIELRKKVQGMETSDAKLAIMGMNGEELMALAIGFAF